RAKLDLAELYSLCCCMLDRYDMRMMTDSQLAQFDAVLKYPPEVAGVPLPDYLDWKASCYWVSATGCPAVSVPGGFTSGGLPVGVQLVGPHRGERALLGHAAAFEAATRHGRRRPPLD